MIDNKAVGYIWIKNPNMKSTVWYLKLYHKISILKQDLCKM